jgi:hypothetical protein
MAERKEPFGATTAAILSGLFVLFIDKLLPLQEFFGELPIIPRVLIAVSAGLFVWKTWSYWEILGGSEEAAGSDERADYDALIAELQAGGTPDMVYREWLATALDRVDMFFGDSGRDDESWIARALGLEIPGARWTAPAFDRCLLLALLYPIITIYLVWIWSGHSGPVERALGLGQTPALGGPIQFLLVLSFTAIIYFFWRGNPAQRILILAYYFAALLAFFLYNAHRVLNGETDVLTPAGGIALAVAAVVYLAFWITFVSDLGGAVVIGIIVVFAVALGGADNFAGIVTDGVIRDVVAMSVPFLVWLIVGRVSRWSVAKGRQGLFLSLFFPLLAVTAFAGAWFTSSSFIRSGPGILLLIFGVLTLVNAPFDWFAIGLTRALLSKGLARAGRSPYFYAAVDGFIAIPVIALLAFVSVLAIQTFDDIAALRSGPEARVMPLDQLFAGLDRNPGDPEYWWVWLMLFSTLIPSAINLGIAATSFMRGAPFLNEWILARMPIDGGIRNKDRRLLTGLLAGQIAGGVLLTGLALYFLGAWLLPIWLPTFGTILRDFSEALAAYDAPGQILKWFTSAR